MTWSFTRRDFCKSISQGLCSVALFDLLNPPAAEAEEKPLLKEVSYYKKLPESKIQCQICPKECEIADLERGYCGNKENRKGTYYSLVYGQSCAAHIDPIEKKPLFHYLPSTTAFSVAAAGCNFECKFCQNWRIAQYRPEQVDSFSLIPRELVSIAKRKGCPTIAFTYTEPVVYYEYRYDTAEHARNMGIGSVMISNGYIKEEPLMQLCKQLNGVKIDLKSFSEKFYKEYCSGERKPVLETLKLLQKIGIWYELVVLIIPTLNDSDLEIRSMCEWIKSELGMDVPIHFSRFHPMYKIKNLPSTPVKTLETAHSIARDVGLNYVYLGNIPGHKAESTYCPGCGKVLIERAGYHIVRNDLSGGACVYCKKVIPGVWENNLAKK